MDAWFFVDAQRQQQGPLTADALRERLAQKQLPRETLVWREGMTEWLPAHAVTEVWPDNALPAPPAEEPLTRVQAPVPMAAADVVYAGFWRRVAAYCLDAVVLSVLGYLVFIPVAILAGIGGALEGQMALGRAPELAMLMPMLLAYPALFVLQACYFGFMHSRPGQATLGKMAVGIKVTDESGGPISFWRGFARYFASWISGLLLCIGYLIAAFTDRKQAIHDFICSTLVVDRWAYTTQPELQKRGLDAVTIVVLVIFGGLTLLMLAGLVLIVAIFAGSLSH